MKPVALLLLCAAVFSSCMPKAQLVTLRGSNLKAAPNGLVLDNDTLTLRYNFSSERGQMFVSLVNKLDRPLYVDWKRSSFIIGKDKVDYWYDVASVDLSAYSYNLGLYRRYNISTISTINGTISKEDPIGFIPPKTHLEKRQFVVVPSGILALPGTPTVIREQAKWDPDRKKPIDIDVYSYADDQQSPLRFRNYLTLSTDKDFKTEFVIDTHFWASDVRILPKDQLTGGMTRQYDGTYSYQPLFSKPDGFYIPVPMQ